VSVGLLSRPGSTTSGRRDREGSDLPVDRVRLRVPAHGRHRCPARIRHLREGVARSRRRYREPRPAAPDTAVWTTPLRRMHRRCSQVRAVLHSPHIGYGPGASVRGGRPPEHRGVIDHRSRGRRGRRENIAPTWRMTLVVETFAAGERNVGRRLTRELAAAYPRRSSRPIGIPRMLKSRSSICCTAGAQQCRSFGTTQLSSAISRSGRGSPTALPVKQCI
jgi:hypothetical protein